MTITLLAYDDTCMILGVQRSPPCSVVFLFYTEVLPGQTWRRWGDGGARRMGSVNAGFLEGPPLLPRPPRCSLFPPGICIHFFKPLQPCCTRAMTCTHICVHAQARSWRHSCLQLVSDEPRGSESPSDSGQPWTLGLRTLPPLGASGPTPSGPAREH